MQRPAVASQGGACPSFRTPPGRLLEAKNGTGCECVGEVTTYVLADGLMVKRVCPQAGPIAAEGSSDNVLG